ncbi:MAG: GDSL-type esterase/lipase family protein [Eubacteriales bacterium]|nr:GDSL-type esterase/lipase family protein [Eubacteriales bacterium]
MKINSDKILDLILPEKSGRGVTILAFRIICALIALSFLIHLFSFNMKADESSKNVESNIKLVESHDFSDVKTVEKKIKATEINQNATSGNGALTSAQYTEIFGNCVFIGDSITSGLSLYGFLSDSQVFSEVGGSLLDAESNFTKAAKTYPDKAFFCYGMNDMGNFRGKEKNFIKKYTSMIKAFKKISPSTKIYVLSISKPSKAAIKRKPTLKNYTKFNKALTKMCADDGFTYIDQTFILEEHPKLYAGDGVHVSPSYYPICLNEIILKAGF